MSVSPEKIKKYRAIALIGILAMGIGSFMACLSTSPAMTTAGNVILAASILVSSYGFIYWRP